MSDQGDVKRTKAQDAEEESMPSLTDSKVTQPQSSDDALAEGVEDLELGDHDQLDPDDIAEVIELDGDQVEGDEGDDDDEKDDSPVDEEQKKRVKEMTDELNRMVENDMSSGGFFEHKDAVFCVALHPIDDNIAASGGCDDLGFIWDRKTGTEKAELKGHTDSVIDVQFSHDGKFLATASMDGNIKLWSPEDGKLVRTLEGPTKEIEWIEWHPRGAALLAGSADNGVYMWNAQTGDIMKVFTGHLGPVLCGGFTPDGKQIVTGSEDGSLYVWDPKKGEGIHHLKGRHFHEGPINCLAFHHESPIVLSGSADGTVRLTNWQTGKVLSSFDVHKDSVEAVGFSKTLKLAATASMDNSIIIWDLTNGSQRAKMTHEDGVVHLRWHATEPLLFTCSLDKTIRLWDARTGQCVKTFTGHQEPVMSFTLTKDQKTIISASDDQTVLFFNL